MDRTALIAIALLLAALALVPVGGALTADGATAATAGAAGIDDAGTVSEVRGGFAVQTDLDDREPVDERAEDYPYSAVGTVFNESSYSSTTPDTTVRVVGSEGAGVLVSPYHVLTAAHNVADDDGEVDPENDIWFAPGVTEIDGEVRAYHGRAAVTKTRILESYDGKHDHPDDLALLTLDRNIGDEVGYWDIAAHDVSNDVWTKKFYHLGYPRQSQMLHGTAAGLDIDDHNGHVLHAGIDEGDSGGPLYTDRTDPAVHSIMAGHRQGMQHAAPITPARKSLLEDYMAADDAPVDRPELYRADRVNGIEDTGRQSTPDQLPPARVDGDRTFTTTLYNDGMADADSVSVAFYLYATAPHNESVPPDRPPVCRTEVSVPSHETARASCEAENLDAIDEAGTASVVPVFAYDGLEEPTVNDREYIGMREAGVPVTDPDGWLFGFEDVSAPESVAAGENFTVTATMFHDRDYDYSAELDADGPEGVTCTPATQAVRFDAGGTATASVECSISSDDVEPLVPIELSIADRTAEAVVHVEESTALTIEAVDAPDDVPAGSEFDVALTLANDGPLPVQEGPLPVQSSLGSCADVDSVALAGESSETVTVACSVPEGTVGETFELEVATRVDEATRELSVTELDYGADVELEPTDYELSLLPRDDLLEVEVGDDYALSATIENVGNESGQRRVAFWSDAECANLDPETVDAATDEIQSDTVVSLDPGESTEVEFYCDMPVGGWLQDTSFWSASLMVQETPEASRYSDLFDTDHDLAAFDIVERVGPPSFDVQGVDAPETATVGESVRVRPTVYNDGGPGEGSVRLLVDGAVVEEVQGHANRNREFGPLSFDYEPGQDHVGEQTLTVETDDDSESVTIEVGDPNRTVLEVSPLDAPAELRPGETVSVGTTVENTGTLDRTVSVEVAADGLDCLSGWSELDVAAGGTENYSASCSAPANATATDATIDVAVGERETNATVRVEPASGGGSIEWIASHEWQPSTTAPTVIPTSDGTGGAADGAGGAPNGSASGTVFVGSSIDGVGGVLTFDVETGAERWARSTGDVAGAPAVANDTAFVVGNDYSETGLYAFDAGSGVERWNVTLDGSARSSPTVANDTVYVTAGDALSAFDAASGDELWRASTGDAIESSPTVAGGTVYVGSSDGNLSAFDAASGDELWRASTGDAIESSPTVAAGTVYVGSWDGHLYAFGAESGDEQWRASVGDAVVSSPTVAGGTVYVGSSDGNLYALDAASGDERWRSPAGGPIGSSPTVAGSGGPAGSAEDATVFVGPVEGSLYAFDGATGDERWQFSTAAEGWASSGFVSSAASPTVADGTLYVAGGDDLYAIDAGVNGSSDGSRVRLGTLGHVGDRAASSDDPGCVAVGGSEVCDTNGDGDYRDVDGDGEVGQGDVAAFFQKQHRDAWKRPELFDFTGNGEVTHGDVVALFDYVALN